MVRRRNSTFTAHLVNTADAGDVPHILDDLRQAILCGAEPPGTPIPVDVVSAFFGVSAIPVREALKILVGEGLVEHRAHVGYHVAKLTFREFQELYEVRQALESAALSWAVRRACGEDDARARAACRPAEDERVGREARDPHSDSRRFHMALIGAARMQRLANMYEAAWNVTEPAQPMARVASDQQRLFRDDHERMLEAFLRRDEELLLTESAHHFDHLKVAIEAFRHDPTVFRGESLDSELRNHR